VELSDRVGGGAKEPSWDRIRAEENQRKLRPGTAEEVHSCPTFFFIADVFLVEMIYLFCHVDFGATYKLLT